MADQLTTENSTSRAMSRRKALTRLGLAAGAIYVAPTIVHLDRSANAKNAAFAMSAAERWQEGWQDQGLQVSNTLGLPAE